MYNYSIIPLLDEHVDEICEDIKFQEESGIADYALFCMPLVPEGNPPINKAEIMCNSYKKFQKKLRAMGLKNGILIQCSIGHGYPLDSLFPFEQYVGLDGGEKQTICCPYDENFREFFKSQIKTLAESKPDVIMLDDDFRLMQRFERGCACNRHLKRFNELAKTDFTREELWECLKKRENQKYRNIFVETQRESIIGAIRVFREGIDEVDPTLQGIVCSAGADMEFCGEIAKIFAGKGNLSIARFNNARYCRETTHGISEQMIRTAQSLNLEKDLVDVFLDESDTCPHCRYSTGATELHTHYTMSILDGAKGVKHWITSMREYEPKGTVAYRKILSKYSKFYEYLKELYPTLKPFGVRMPLSKKRMYYFDVENPYELDKSLDESWIRCVFERLGIPFYISGEGDGIITMSGVTDIRFSDDEIKEMLSKTVMLSSDEALRLNERGFLKYTGVKVEDWDGENITAELILENGEEKVNRIQVGTKKLVPIDDSVEILSWNYHLDDGVNKRKVCPASIAFKNELGGTVIVFSGTPDAPFHFSTAFSFLYETRKRQIADIIKKYDKLPVYYDGDAEILLRAWYDENENIVSCVYNLGFDVLDDIAFVTDRKIKKVEFLDCDGQRKPCEFSTQGDRIIVERQINVLSPEVFFFED